jgi:hypothetical protein
LLNLNELGPVFAEEPKTRYHRGATEAYLEGYPGGSDPVKNLLDRRYWIVLLDAR